MRFADPRAASDAVYQILSKALVSAFSLPPVSRAAWGRAATARAAEPVLAPLAESQMRPPPKPERELPFELMMTASARSALLQETGELGRADDGRGPERTAGRRGAGPRGGADPSAPGGAVGEPAFHRPAAHDVPDL